MKLSLNFLKDYVDIPADVDSIKLGEDMTNIGNEYDEAGKLIKVSGLTIGKILECEMHPDSDHLHICKVDVGQGEPLQIVCGAPNARVGIKVIVAMIGAKLPGGEIKKGKLRGVESCGMLCSIEELGLEHKFLKPADIEGIAELGEDAVVGEDPIKYLGLDDEVIDFELTANRGDLLSILGMAYEVGALYGNKVKDIDLSHNDTSEDFSKEFNLDIQTENCSLFYAKKVTDVVIKESPEFIKNRLIASGIRPINNVVDISNYVMLEVGQPLHYYDADRLGNTLIVRMANDGEKITTLDEQERELTSNDIVIADKRGPIGLAGVMGGLSTEVEQDTKNIVIEAAIFDNVKIRLTSKKILRSESSNRFEKGLDPKRTLMAIERSCHLLEKYADAKVVGGMCVYDKNEKQDRVIEVTYSKIKQVLGMDIPNEDVKDILTRLALDFEEDGDTLKVTIPTRRLDIQIKEDIIHDIGRFYGMDRMEGKKMILPVVPGSYDKFKRNARNKMVSLGLNETLSYALIPEAEVQKFSTEKFETVKILDPMTEERNALRNSLLPSLMMVYEYNKNRGARDISIFEIGKSFHKIDGQYGEHLSLSCLMTGNYKKALNKANVDFYVIKGVLENLLDYLGFNGRYALKVEDLPTELHPGQAASVFVDGHKVGIIGKLHPLVTKDNIYVMELNLEKLAEYNHDTAKYKEISKFPGIEKDVAFVVANEIKSEDIEAIIKSAGGKMLKAIEVFDVYTGENLPEGKKSYAYNLKFENPERTLSDEEVTVVFEKIMDNVCKEIGAEIRK
ncbi:MAG: phenylalanine--tRNA ligase subunit beta [Clostridia bacterium]|nr:phenylalanine--tRNA ligase subunit beta [Clostridia bacterium]